MDCKKALLIKTAVLISLVLTAVLTPYAEEVELKSDPTNNSARYGFLCDLRDDPVNVNIAAVNANYFPEIHFFVQVTDSVGTPILGLNEENFTLYENGLPTNIDVAPFDVDGTTFGLALDCSGSMGGAEDDVIYACTTFVSCMRPLDQAAIVFFSSFSNTRVIQTMTNDHELLNNAILTYGTGGVTALWYGYYLALLECQEELPPLVMIGFTDGRDNASGSFTIDDVTLLAQAIGAPVYSIGLDNVLPDPLIQVANNTGGSYIYASMDSLWWYYLQIQHAYQNMYEIAYISPYPIPDGMTRWLEITADYQGNSDTDTSKYFAPWVLDFAPRFTLTPYTIDSVLSQPQQANQPFTISAWITDNDNLTMVRIKHRHIGETSYNSGVMNHVADSLYKFTFLDFYVQDPGIEFYLLAVDSYLHVTTLPQSHPGYYPYQVAILPNNLPSIEHTPISIWPDQTEMLVSCDVLDSTTSVESVVLFYQNTSEIFWTEIPMQNVGGDTWEGTVPAGDMIASLDLEYFVRAWDDVSSFYTHGPHFVNVGLPPLEITLTPYNPPIQIPATGGSFDFNIALTNLETAPLNFDAWIIVTLPDGSPFGPVLGPVNLTIPGSSSVDRDRIQSVPSAAPSGEYIYHAYAGIYPGYVWVNDSFTFEKLETGEGDGIMEWTNFGEPFDTICRGEACLALQGITLLGAHPNPFNPATTISFTLPEPGQVNLEVFDIHGRCVGVGLAPTRQYPAGTHHITFDGSGLASGIYIYRLTTGDFTASGKMILMK